MAAGRRSPPLFDVVSKTSDVNTSQDRRTTMNPGVGWRPGMAPQPPAKPDRSGRPGSPESKPASSTGYSTLSPSHEPPSPTGQETSPADVETGHPQWIKSILGPNTVRVPVNTIYLVTAIFILAVVIATVVGYRIATRSSSSDLASRQGLVPPVTEPDDLDRKSVV